MYTPKIMLMPDYIEEKERLTKENQELKKQLEEKQNPFKGIFAQVNDDTLLRDCGNMNAEMNELKNQQKEFIKYMEDYINEMKTATVYDSVFTDAEVTEIVSNVLCLVLKEYKEIIGVSDENNIK